MRRLLVIKNGRFLQTLCSFMKANARDDIALVWTSANMAVIGTRGWLRLVCDGTLYFEL